MTEKSHHKDKRIDSFTIHQNQMKEYINPLLKTKVKQTITFFWQKDGRQRI